MSLFSAWMTDARLDAVVELAPGWVTAAVGQGPRLAAAVTEPLPNGALVPSLTEPNLADRATVLAAVRTALGALDRRPRRVAVIVPDLSARVSLVPFAQVPGRQEDLDQLIRWQIRKTAPFQMEEAAVGYTLAGRGADGGQVFAVTLARRSVIREYEDVLAALGAHAGLVDVATLAATNTVLGSGRAHDSDWLVVHLRPEYTSLGILRGHNLLFFRTRAVTEDETVADLVHQTVMYYEDRLTGQGFSQVFLGGRGHDPTTIDAVREDLDKRMGVPVESLDPSSDDLPNALKVRPKLVAVAGPAAGMLRRAHDEPLGI